MVSGRLQAPEPYFAEMPRSLYPRGKAPSPIEYKPGWRFVEGRKFTPVTGIEPEFVNRLACGWLL